MPPPIPEHMKRYTANITRPARYRPSKAVPEEESSDEDGGEGEEEQQKASKPQRSQARRKAPSRPVAQEEEEDEDDEEGFVTEDEDDVDGGATLETSQSRLTAQSIRPAVGQNPSRSLQTQAKPVSQAPPTAEDEDEEEDESEDESEEEEDSSSEEEAPQRKFQRPTFIKKTARNVSGSGTQNSDNTIESTPAPGVMSSHHTDDVTARRLAEAEKLIKNTIERDTAARLAGKKSWDDDDLLPEALVDDTDGLDPEAEHSAWRLREMHRLKRDREAMIAREEELEEIERRRNLSAAEREAEDREFIAKQKEEKEEGRGKAGFLSKYHHKGAFFMDDETSERLAKRDLAGARFADDVTDKSTLPEYMRIRDMTKLGKKGRTRYTDLKGQDTGRFGDEVKRWRGSGYENRDANRPDDLRGVDDRFLPDDERESRGPRASGANASAVGERRVRQRSRSRSKSDDERRRPRRRSYSRSRSRSPPRKSRRQRSPSPYQEGDRRRGVAA